MPAMTDARPLPAALALVALAVTALVLAACGSDGAQRRQERDTSTVVRSRPASRSRARTRSTVPPTSSCSRRRGTAPCCSTPTATGRRRPHRRTSTAPSTAAEPAPGYSDGDKTVSDALLAQGYALAGSAYASNGWAVADGVKADEDLYAYFVKEVGTPNRTYVWGDSLGGLITQMVAQKHPDWVSGAAPLCGVLGGPEANVNLSLDVAYALKTFVNPDLKLSGFTSWDDAVQNWETTAQIVLAADRRGHGQRGCPDDARRRALVDAPSQTSSYDGSTVESQVEATAESRAHRPRLLPPSVATTSSSASAATRRTTLDADYATRISDAERSLMETLGGQGETDKLLAELAAGRAARTPPRRSRSSRPAVRRPVTVQDPTITMHTKADPLVLVQNETLFFQRVTSNAKRTRTSSSSTSRRRR